MCVIWSKIPYMDSEVLSLTVGNNITVIKFGAVVESERKNLIGYYVCLFVCFPHIQ